MTGYLVFHMCMEGNGSKKVKTYTFACWLFMNQERVVGGYVGWVKNK